MSMSRTKGKEAEDKACVFLRENGFEIIERNFFARYGEIDIIAQKNGILHFIEVKSASVGAKSGFEPIYNITPSKIEKLISTIGFYLSTQNLTQEYCLDALIIKGEHIELVENITLC